MASVYSFVEALPPKSPVMCLPSAMVWECVKTLGNSIIRFELDAETHAEGSLFDVVSHIVQVHVPVRREQRVRRSTIKA